MTPDGNRNGIDVLAGESRTGAGLPQSGHLFADRTGVEDIGSGSGPDAVRTAPLTHDFSVAQISCAD